MSKQCSLPLSNFLLLRSRQDSLLRDEDEFVAQIRIKQIFEFISRQFYPLVEFTRRRPPPEHLAPLKFLDTVVQPTKKA